MVPRMILTTGQGLDFVASFRSTQSSIPIGHNYRLWLDVTGSVRLTTGLILPRATLDRALAKVAKQFDHHEFRIQMPQDQTPRLALAISIWQQLASHLGAARLGSLEISDETGHGFHLGTQSLGHPLPEGDHGPRSTAKWEGWGEGELSLPTNVPTAFTLSGGFSAAHRAHAPRLSEAENRALFGTSNNPAGHGHNYWVEIESPTLISDQPPPWAALDHLNLSHDVPELQGRNAVTETVAEWIARRAPPAARVRVWESADLFAGFDDAATRYQLGRRYRFHAAHDLFNASLSEAANLRRYGRCALASPHGHAYTAYVVVEGALDPVTDTVYNLADLDVAAGVLFRSIDFTDWRQTLPELRQAPATGENVALAMWDRLSGLIGAPLVEFCLYETPSQRFQVKRGSDG
jgi:6-pyruvoyl-tetrahydropterin synthase